MNKKNRLPAKKGLTTYYVWHIMQEERSKERNTGKRQGGINNENI